MSSRFSSAARGAVMAALFAAASPALAQQAYDVDPEMRIQQLENQLRQLTGQNEELQYRNRQLEDRLRQLGAGPAPAGQPAVAQPGMAAIPAQPAPVSRQPIQQAPYEPQIAAPAPIVQEPPAPPVQGRRRGDAFDPGQNPNAPGAPRALGGGPAPAGNEAAVGA